jgi:hypothetical protein
MKLLLVVAGLIGSLAIGVTAASASQTFTAGIYGNTTSTCNDGSTDTSGARYGTFMATETHHDQLVSASVTVDNLHADRPYNVAVTESGHSCLTTHMVASFTTDDHGKAVVHFTFWAHTAETSAWVTIQHGHINDIYRSTSLPINR